MIFVALLLWLLIILSCSIGTQHLWASTTKSRVLVVVLAPGLLVHEMSHVLACLVMGATVKEASLSNAGASGKVVHTKPVIPVLGQAVISLAPMLGCGACLLLVTAGVLQPAGDQFAPDYQLPQELLRPDACAHYLVEVVKDMWEAITGADYRDWRTYLFLYLAAVLVIHLSPSKRDWGTGFLSIIALCGLVFVAGQVWPEATARPVREAWPFLTLCLGLSLSILVLSLVVIGIVRLIRLLIHPGA